MSSSNIHILCVTSWPYTHFYITDTDGDLYESGVAEAETCLRSLIVDKLSSTWPDDARRFRIEAPDRSMGIPGVAFCSIEVI